MSVVSGFLLFVAAVVTSNGSLSGQVEDENGVPIAGAVVDIYTAKPRVGAAITCPSCYRDCIKSTKTDADGQYSIGELDSGLLFRILVMAPGRRSHLTELIDPQSEVLNVKLEPIPKRLSADCMLTGLVLDDQGKPLAGAVVSPVGAKTSDRRWWGRLPGVDEASITDAKGRFVITSRDPKLGIDLQVASSGFADFPSQLFELNGCEHQIRMQLGAGVVGKLICGGLPVRNRAIGIVQKDRSPLTFVGERVVATDDKGNFQFPDLQPNQTHVLYTLCEPNPAVPNADSFTAIYPVLDTQTIKTAGSGGLTQLGELELVPGLTLTGRITFPTGSVLPDEVKLRLSRDPAWDWLEMAISDDGEFAIRGLPSEIYSVSVHAPGFVVDSSKFHFQMTGPSEFVTRLNFNSKSSAGLAIPMRPKDNM